MKPSFSRRFTLSRRVVWTVTLVVAFVVALQSILAYLAMHAQEDEFSDDMLKREVQILSSQMARPGLTPVGTLAASQKVEAFLSRSNEPLDSIPRPLANLPVGLHQVSAGGRTLHVAVLETDDGRLTVALDATESESRVVRFGYILLATWAFCVAVTALAARRVAAIAVAPIAQATRRIVHWSHPHNDGEQAMTDEVTALVEAFNEFRDRADEQVTREREFTSNLSHEIRTPLTAIRTDAELLGVGAHLTADDRRRTDRIASSVDEVMASLESSLSASSGRTVAPATFQLAEAVKVVCDSLRDRATARGLAIESTVDRGRQAAGDRQAFLTVCRNIVRNAIEHAAPGTLRIGGDAARLFFCDDGPGIDGADLPHVFERYHSSRLLDTAAHAGEPYGLGLAIARRLCDLRGWTLDVRSPAVDGRGTEFVLGMPSHVHLA